MKNRITVAMAGAAFAVLALAGCSSAASPAAAPSEQSSAPSAGTELATASTSLGTVVVDGTGMTAYVFDKDEPGETASACTGACATTWPAIVSASTSPKVSGISGTIATLPAADGKLQITIDGMPLYTYAADSAAGDVKGQGVGGSWWAVMPSGTKIGSGSGSVSTPNKGGY